MPFVLKLSLFVMGLCGAFGLFVAILDKSYLRIVFVGKGIIADIFELLFIGALKIFALGFFLTLLLVPVSLISSAILELNDMIINADELSFVIFAAFAWFAISGLISLVILFRKVDRPDKICLETTPTDQPLLHSLVNKIAAGMNSRKADTRRLTYDSSITLREEICSLDHIYYGGKLTWEIGLAAFQYLSESDLEVLLAQEQGKYAIDGMTPGHFTNRLLQRIELMTENLKGSIFSLNPCWWFIRSIEALIPIALANAINAERSRIESQIASHYGLAKLNQARLRLAVESEVYRGLIPDANSKRRAGMEEMDNLYQFIRLYRGAGSPDRRAAESMILGDKKYNIFQRLVLKRPAEVSYFEPLIEQSAVNYLRDGARVEQRMMSLINSTL